MQKILGAIKSNWKMIAYALVMLGGMIGYVEFRTDPNAKNIIVILPESLGADPLVLQAKAGERNRPILTAIAKVKAAKIYAKEKDIALVSALTLARHVSDEQIATAAKEAGLSFEAMPVGGPLQDLLDWIAAHPEFMEKLVQIILMFIPLFA